MGRPKFDLEYSFPENLFSCGLHGVLYIHKHSYEHKHTIIYTKIYIWITQLHTYILKNI